MIKSGRAARRAAQFGPSRRLKGAGWTRKFRKGREQRQLVSEIDALREVFGDAYERDEETS